jgi:tRNA(Ile2) C34 agmatinyltransferase TiaS
MDTSGFHSEEARCPYCREEIRADAIKCKHCGEFLNSQLREERAVQRAQTKHGIWR